MIGWENLIPLALGNQLAALSPCKFVTVNVLGNCQEFTHPADMEQDLSYFLSPDEYKSNIRSPFSSVLVSPDF